MNSKTNFLDTDLCVKCGLCLPHCPTYSISHNENESPRGRLALIQGWSEGGLELSNSLKLHIDSCLTCRACESMCPAHVPYSQLINEFRAQTDCVTNISSVENVFLNALTGNYRSFLNKAIRLYQGLGINKLPIDANKYLPDSTSANDFKETYATTRSSSRGRVALFTGCASSVLDAATIKDAIYLLQHIGYDVSIPKSQVCCGAIDLHAGKRTKYKKFASKNTRTFNDDSIDAIITVASGCGSTLSDYDSDIADKVVDINDFIAPYLADLSFKPHNATAWLHTPCTLKNALSKGVDIAGGLARIGSLNIHTFDSNQFCCGAAGTYMLTHKDNAETLREKTISPVINKPTNYLLTSNIGCALHLRAGLKQAGLNTKVLHPVSLLAQQLIT